MFGSKYSRMKFWLITIPVALVGSFVIGVFNNMGAEGAYSITSLIVITILIHILANRIRGFGSNPWLALWDILPFVGLFQAFYYGLKKSGNIPQEKP